MKKAYRLEISHGVERLFEDKDEDDPANLAEEKMLFGKRHWRERPGAKWMPLLKEQMVDGVVAMRIYRSADGQSTARVVEPVAQPQPETKCDAAAETKCDPQPQPPTEFQNTTLPPSIPRWELWAREHDALHPNIAALIRKHREDPPEGTLVGESFVQREENNR